MSLISWFDSVTIGLLAYLVGIIGLRVFIPRKELGGRHRLGLVFMGLLILGGVAIVEFVSGYSTRDRLLSALICPAKPELQSCEDIRNREIVARDIFVPSEREPQSQLFPVNSAWAAPSTVNVFGMCRQEEDNSKCLRDVLSRFGASSDAISASTALQEYGFGPSYITEFRELGPVDYGVVYQPFFSGDRYQPVLLNGDPNVIQIHQALSRDIAPLLESESDLSRSEVETIILRKIDLTSSQINTISQVLTFKIGAKSKCCENISINVDMVFDAKSRKFQGYFLGNVIIINQ